jgi:hypothetical protein
MHSMHEIRKLGSECWRLMAGISQKSNPPKNILLALSNENLLVYWDYLHATTS